MLSSVVLAEDQKKRYNAKAYRSAYYKARRKSDPAGVHKRDHIAYYKRTSTADGRVKALFAQAKNRAKRTGIDFDIELEDIYPLPDVCPFLGIKIIYDETGIRTGNSPSLDRITGAKGYTKGNVLIVSWRANRLKNDATAYELRLIADNLDRIVAAKTKGD